MLMVSADFVLAGPARTVRVGVFPFIPGISMDANGKAQGFFADMLQEVAAREGWKLVFVPGSWAEGLDRVRGGEVDLVTSVARTPEREQYLQFGEESAFTVWSILYANPRVPIQGLLDVHGRRVAVMRNDVNGQHFKELCSRFGIRCAFVETGSFPEVLGMVAAGGVDAGVTASTFGYSQEGHFKVTRTPVVFDPFNLFFATSSRAGGDLLKALDDYLREGKRNPDSSYHRSINRWLRTEHDPGLPHWILYLIGSILAALALAVISVEVFRHQVARATRKIRDLNAELAQKLSEKQAAEAEILRMNEDLEARVKHRTAELETANKEMEAFSYSVSHDLRAPLRSIDGFSQILLEDYRDRVDDTGRHYLARIRQGTQRMAQLISDLLKLAQTSRSETVPADFDFSRMCQAVADDLAHAGPERRVEVAIQPGMQVHGDPSLMQLVAENLLGNAWKFTSRCPDARIEVGALVSPQGERTFFVRDNGAGFDMAYAGKLFSAFQRLHSSAEFDGTGIGLAIVQRIIQRHGGRVWAEAAPGRGATFRFTLQPPVT